MDILQKNRCKKIITYGVLSIFILGNIFYFCCCKGKCADTHTQTSDATNTVSPCYAIANKMGSRFLILTNKDSTLTIDIAKNYTHAIYGSRCYQIKYLGYQTENVEKNTHNEAWQNFDCLSGFLYENLDEQICPEDARYINLSGSVYLTDCHFINNITIIPSQIIVGATPNERLVQYMEIKIQTPIQHAQIAASFGTDNCDILCTMQIKTVENGISTLYAFYDTNANSNNLIFSQPIGGYTNQTQYMVNTVLKTAEGYTFLIDETTPTSVSSYLIVQQGDSLIKSPEIYHRAL
ncbi:MAG: hypothetical protein PHH23_04380 [Paludibacteraceae bacterium]|nr:hypothetical protein [Paludibacteraceae bacterium]